MPRLSTATRRQRILDQITQLSTGAQRRYPDPLRNQIIDYAQRRRADGVTIASICTELGVSEPTLSRLLAESKNRMRPVRVAQNGVCPNDNIQRGPVVRGPRDESMQKWGQSVRNHCRASVP